MAGGEIAFVLVLAQPSVITGKNEQNEAHISNGASCHVSLSRELDLLAMVESLA